MAEQSPVPKLTGELALMAELDAHLSKMGPKTRAEAADCVYGAVDVALRERLDPDIVRRAVGWSRDRAREAAEEAQATYDRRKAEKVDPGERGNPNGTSLPETPESGTPFTGEPPESPAPVVDDET